LVRLNLKKVFFRKVAYIGEKLEKNGVFSIERKSIANNEKARKFWSLEVIPSRGYVSSFLVNGGEEGIRTLETVTRLHAFQACAFDHSATSPLNSS
jgi:hypothetical protein